MICTFDPVTIPLDCFRANLLRLNHECKLPRALFSTRFLTSSVIQLVLLCHSRLASSTGDAIDHIPSHHSCASLQRHPPAKLSGDLLRPFPRSHSDTFRYPVSIPKRCIPTCWFQLTLYVSIRWPFFMPWVSLTLPQLNPKMPKRRHIPLPLSS